MLPLRLCSEAINKTHVASDSSLEDDRLKTESAGKSEIYCETLSTSCSASAADSTGGVFKKVHEKRVKEQDSTGDTIENSHKVQFSQNSHKQFLLQTGGITKQISLIKHLED